MDEIERQVDAAARSFEELLGARAVVICTRLPDYDNHHEVFGDGVVVFDVDSSYVEDVDYDEWAAAHFAQAERLRDAGLTDAADHYVQAIIRAAT